MAEETPNDAKESAIPASAIGSRKDQARVKGDRFQSVYANNVAVGFSNFDANLVFGEIVDERDDQPVIEEILKVNMSRELAKALAVILGQHLVAWEKQFGVIKIPDLTQPIPLEVTGETMQEEEQGKAAAPLQGKTKKRK